MPIDKRDIRRGAFLTGAANPVDDGGRKFSRGRFMTVDGPRRLSGSGRTTTRR